MVGKPGQKRQKLTIKNNMRIMPRNPARAGERGVPEPVRRAKATGRLRADFEPSDPALSTRRDQREYGRPVVPHERAATGWATGQTMAKVIGC